MTLQDWWRLIDLLMCEYGDETAAYPHWVDAGRPLPTNANYCEACDRGERIELSDINYNGEELCDEHYNMAYDYE